TTTAVTINPVVRFVASPFTNPGTSVPFGFLGYQEPIDFQHLADVTASIGAAYKVTSWTEGTGILHAALALANTGSYPITGPLLVGVRNISAPDVRAVAFDGVTPAGLPYYDVTHLAFPSGSGQFGP